MDDRRGGPHWPGSPGKNSSPLFHRVVSTPHILGQDSKEQNRVKPKTISSPYFHRPCPFLPPITSTPPPIRRSIEVKLDLPIRRRLVSDHSPDLARPVLFTQFGMFGNQVRRIILCRFSRGTRGALMVPHSGPRSPIVH